MKIKLHPLPDVKRRRIKVKLNLHPLISKREPETPTKPQTRTYTSYPPPSTGVRLLAPPNTAELGSTVPVYEEYGLTAKEAAMAGIRALDYVRIESPQFVEHCEEIPYALADMIDHFDLVWVLSVESSYAERRRWNDFISFREFLQNALDSMHESVGYENIKVDVSVNELGTWVMDRGKGLDHTAFLLGGKDKKCYLRGRYGEGLKVASLWFASRKHDIYIFTHDNVFKCWYPEAGLLTVVFGKNKKYVYGTWILITDYKVPSEDLRKLYYKLGDFHVAFRHDTEHSDCPHKMPNLILEPGDCLYVRDIFVNKISEMFGTPSYFSYNLWWVDLEPNRVQVQSTWELQKEMAGLLVNTPKITDIIDACMVQKEYGGIYYFLVEPRYYELQLRFTEPPAEIARAITAHFSDIAAYSVPGDLDAVAATAHEGGKCILIPNDLIPLFSNMRSAADFVIDSKKESLEGATKIDERTLSQSSRGTLRAWRLIADYAVRGIKIVVISGNRSFYRNKTIYIAEDELEIGKVSTLIHELSHALGEDLYGNATDLSENFEDALAKVGSLIYGIMHDEQMSKAIQRAELGGAIFAESKSNYDFFSPRLYEYYKSHPRDLEDELIFPTPIILVVDREKIQATGVITVEEKPMEEYYYIQLEEKLERYKNFINELFADREKCEIQVRERCKEIEIYFPYHLASYIRDTASRIEIFVYDLKEDKYIFKEEMSYI